VNTINDSGVTATN